MQTEQLQLLIQSVEATPQPVDGDKARRLRGVLTQLSLRDEKVLFEQTRSGSDPWTLHRIDRADAVSQPEATWAETAH